MCDELFENSEFLESKQRVKWTKKEKNELFRRYQTFYLDKHYFKYHNDPKSKFIQIFNQESYTKRTDGAISAKLSALMLEKKFSSAILRVDKIYKNRQQSKMADKIKSSWTKKDYQKVKDWIGEQMQGKRKRFQALAREIEKKESEVLFVIKWISDLKKPIYTKQETTKSIDSPTSLTSTTKKKSDLSENKKKNQHSSNKRKHSTSIKKETTIGGRLSSTKKHKESIPVVVSEPFEDTQPSANRKIVSSSQKPSDNHQPPSFTHKIEQKKEKIKWKVDEIAHISYLAKHKNCLSSSRLSRLCDKFSCSEQSILLLFNRMKQKEDPKSYVSSVVNDRDSWNDVKIETLKDVWQQGHMSIKKIAILFETSEEEILSKIRLFQQPVSSNERLSTPTRTSFQDGLRSLINSVER